ncbi:uncharacterized protein SPAPADRAFT_60376 [Spathaspora passalidarum NRRL Y-27907]|uniref:RanBD1 domain-containing protein n=1 Tax=Spathaspora passalidarum (strain NRRL Y-27907 / 11-Y1) TaxID=619300 RepID=G3AL16_SPAPN|nr:uncharacterized protein SPAPADRAFT_60376 [Spathaspora passalidarum NRRL Y-27907]EGW33059.1 hypothetical protein SPAPADRAFT_60376 [Spathaspora passalidarum NRRL Y-27907]
MSEESTKRKIESEGSSLDAKRTKSTNDDLRQSIIQEVTKKLESRIDKLESRIDKLEREFASDDEDDDSYKEGQTLTDDDNDNDVATKTTPTDPPQLPKREGSVPLPAGETKKATFGTSSFKFTPSKLGSETPVSPPKTNKPVFGATTMFGKSIADDLKNRPSVCDTLPSKLEASKLDSSSSQDDKTSSPPPKVPKFGSHSKFGNAFQESLHKKSFLDSNDTEKDDKSATPPPQQQFKQVDLAPVHLATGEEDEISHFNSVAKIFELDLTAVNEGWKERGVGPLHLNQSRKDQNQARLVMRSQGLLRVVLNYKITKDTTLLKGLEASLSPGKYLRLNSVKDGKPVQYMLKFSNESLRDELIEKVESLKSQIKQE